MGEKNKKKKVSRRSDFLREQESRESKKEKEKVNTVWKAHTYRISVHRSEVLFMIRPPV